jgi:hypothetical protein
MTACNSPEDLAYSIHDYSVRPSPISGITTGNAVCNELKLDGPPLAELSIVRLRHPVPDESLQSGETGTVVHVYDEGAGYEVEFVRGHTPPVVATLMRKDLEPLE